jgi:hypothetical protein
MELQAQDNFSDMVERTRSKAPGWRQPLKLFINHMDAWGVAMIISALALVSHASLSLRHLTVLLAIAGAYWFGFAYNDYQDAPFDAMDPAKGRNNFFVGARFPTRWLRLALVVISITFISAGFLLFQMRGAAVMAFSLLVIWAYSGRPLRLKSRAGLDLLSHALFVETYPYVVTVMLLAGSWTRLDVALVAILMLSSLSAQLEQQLADCELDAKTEPNFTTWLGPWKTLQLLRGLTAVLALLGAGLVMDGTIPRYLVPFGLIAAPMLAHRFVRPPGQRKASTLKFGTMAAGFLYATVMVSYVVLGGLS